MNHFANSGCCIPFANGDCASSVRCPLQHDVFKCSCRPILSFSAQEKSMDSTNRGKNPAALQSQQIQDSLTTPTPAFYVGYATVADTKCRSRKKPCSGSMIRKGGLQFGVLVQKDGRTYFSWWHWGCLTEGIFKTLRRQFSEASEIAGFEKLWRPDQAKVTQAWLDGAIAWEDVPCKTWKRKRAFKKNVRNETPSEDVPQMIASIFKNSIAHNAHNEEDLEVDYVPAGSEREDSPKAALQEYVAPLMPKIKATYCLFFATGHCKLGETCYLEHDMNFKCSCGLMLSVRGHLAPMLSENLREHLANIQTGRSSFTASLDQPQEPIECTHCGEYIENASYDLHAEEHLRQQRHAQLEAQLDAGAEDQHGVGVSGRLGVDFGVVNPDSTVEAKMLIHCATSRVALRGCRMRSSPRQDEYGDQFSALLLGSRTINQGTTRTISIVMHPSSLPGYFEDTLDILLTDIDKKSKFIITRKVEGTIRSKEDRALGGAKCT